VFDSWSDGRPASHTVTATNTTNVYTATFVSLVAGFAQQQFELPEAGGSATITVTLNAPSAETRTVSYSTQDDTAAAGPDYTASAGTLTFAPGEISKTFSVPILDNRLDQPDRGVVLRLRGGSGVAIGEQASATLVIRDDDPAPAVGFTSQSFTVRESGGGVEIALALDAPSGQSITVEYATKDGTSRAGRDYTASAGTLTFAPGEISKTFSVPILDNRLDEGNGTLGLQLSNPSNAAPGLTVATLTIEDDDPPPTVALSAPAFFFSEADGAVTIDVVLSARSGREVSVAYATANGSAVAGGDYAGTSGQLVFARGETRKSIRIPINDDQLNEPTDVFNIGLSAPRNAVIGNPAGATLTIRDDDPLTTVAFTAPALNVAENGRNATVTVALGRISGQAVTVQYTTRNGTAVAGKDYRATSGTLTFRPGESRKRVAVPILNDNVINGDRAFQVVLRSPGNATLAQPAVVALTIKNDDRPVVQFSAAKYDEYVYHADDRTPRIIITVTLDLPSPLPITVTYNTSDGTREAGKYYRAASGTLTFQPGVTIQRFSVVTVAFASSPQTVKLTLSKPVNAALGRRTATVDLPWSDLQ
jgi:hypothetical protein